MWLPRPIKRRLRPLPQWCAIGLDVPQGVTVTHLLCAGRELEVTHTNVVASLRPLTIAIGADAEVSSALARDHDAHLRFTDRELDWVLGELALHHTSTKTLGGIDLAFFEVRSDKQFCVSGPYRLWNEWLQGRAARKNTDAHNFSMSQRAVQQTMIMYMSPRPVVLVSVEEGDHSNLFPMDLIGPVHAERFTLALRSTSRSVPVMQSARRVALSDVAAKDYQIAYRLGAHHKAPQVDWNALPFGIGRSRAYSLPVPSIALRVREMEILEVESIGSHTFFVCRAVSDEVLAAGERFCHTSGFHEYFRRRRRLGFRLAT